MANLSKIHLQDIDIKLESSPHEDIPKDCKIFTQIIFDHYVFAQTTSVDPTDEERETWKLEVNCVIPSDVWSFCIAVLREGPPIITRLLGTIDIARGEILAKAQNGEQNPIAMSLRMITVNNDGPSIIIKATVSVRGPEIPHFRASDTTTNAEIMLPRLEKLSLNPDRATIPLHLYQMRESFRKDEEADVLEIAMMHERLLLIPSAHHLEKAWLLNILGDICSREHDSREIGDLHRAIIIYGDAMREARNNFSFKAEYWSDLGASLLHQFERLGDLTDLDRSAQVFERAVELTPDGHSDKPSLFSNLGSSLITRFERLGDLSDLNRSVQVFEQAIQLTSDGHPAKAVFFNNLGNSLTTRFKRLGDLSDLNRSVQVFEQAIQLTSDGHPAKAVFFNNLGSSLTTRFKRLGDLSDLNRAVQIKEQALELTPDGHPDKPSLFSNLGISFTMRFGRLGDLSDLNKSVKLLEQAVQLTPDDHPDKAAFFRNLGCSLKDRFERLGDLSDLDRAVQVEEQAVELTPDGHPDKASRFSNLGYSLLWKFQNCGNAEVMKAAITSFSSAAVYLSAPLSVRFPAAQAWMNLMKLSQIHAPYETMQSCEVAMSLIPQLMSLGAAITDWHYQIQSAGSTTRNAAAVAIAAERYDTALGWLEQGRSLVWNQLLQFHLPMDDLRHAHPELASKLQSLSLLLEASTTYSTSSNHQNLTIHQNYHEVAHQREVLLCHIRQQNGFERFLLHKTVSQLLPAAKMGPIVTLNAGMKSIDALILRHEFGILHVPLMDLSFDGSESPEEEFLKQNHAENSGESISSLLVRLGSEDVEPTSSGRYPLLADIL